MARLGTAGTASGMWINARASYEMVERASIDGRLSGADAGRLDERWPPWP